jgi:outer membrane protein OmpA-like peptidoglycan-associated protein
VRIGVPAVLLLFAVPASADEAQSRLEASGFLGVDYYGDKISLGKSPAPEQRPQTAPTFGGRLTYVVFQLGGDIHLDLGVEAEGSFTASWTGYGFDGPRPSYFAPVLGYHGNLLLRLAGGPFQPHLTAGGGGETVISASPYMADETDGILQWGAGVSFQLGPKWQMRFDARQGLMPAVNDDRTFTYEAHFSIGARLGVKATPAPIKRVAVVATPTEPIRSDRDTDGDALPDAIDQCIREAETVNGVDDQDGCPEADRDHDSVVDAADRCPLVAEDRDTFEDDDGCPDGDNDSDRIADQDDTCPLEAETKNGLADDDGCPDELPAAITSTFAEAHKVTFEKGRAPLTKAGKAALDKIVAVSLANKRLALTVTVHADGTDQAATDLATKRLVVVKFYLTEQGVAMMNLTTVVGPAVTDKKTPLVVVSPTTN